MLFVVAVYCCFYTLTLCLCYVVCFCGEVVVLFVCVSLFSRPVAELAAMTTARKCNDIRPVIVLISRPTSAWALLALFGPLLLPYLA